MIVKVKFVVFVINWIFLKKEWFCLILCINFFLVVYKLNKNIENMGKIENGRFNSIGIILIFKW